ncbi:MAG: hypothetical protein PHE88_05390 [Elusimicrobia bacterium]|nr:hypothetical protein [Elusimicrobiota bacterium]
MSEKISKKTVEYLRNNFRIFMKQILILSISKYFLLTCLFSCFLVHCLYGEVGVGIGWPYFSVKYNFSKYAGEGRIATGEGISVYAVRGYWNFYSEKKINCFTGVEGGYITFNTLDIKGNGVEGSIFLGGEYSFAKQISIAMDFSPVLIGMKSDDFKVSGVELVANMAVYFYLPEESQDISTSWEKATKRKEIKSSKKSGKVNVNVASEQELIAVGFDNVQVRLIIIDRKLEPFNSIRDVPKRIKEISKEKIMELEDNLTVK